MSEAVREKKLPGFRKYKPYPAYKDSGVEWLGDVPEHWDLKRLRYSIRACLNGVWGEEPVGGPEDVICVRVADFDRIKNKIVLNEPTFRSVPLRQLEELTLKSGDLLLEKSGGGEQQPVGAVVLYDLGAQSVCSNFIARIKIEDDYSSVFLLYLHKHLYESGVNKRSIKQNTGIQNLDLKSYLSEYVGLPDIKEQIAIASFLDRETAKIDALIAKQERLIELLQEKRTALITRAVTKGLDPDVPMKDSGVEWLGEIPAHWKVKPLKAVAFVNPETLAEDTDPDYEFDYIEITDVNFDGSISGKEFMYFNNAPSRAKRKVIQGDIIISTVRTYLKAIALIKESNTRELIVSTGFAVLRNKDKGELENEFLWRLVQSSIFVEKVVSYSEGVSYPAITPYVLGTLPIWFPPPTEQKEIVLFLNRKIGKIDYLTSKVHKSIELLKEHRTALISAAVTGKIDVRREVP